MFGKKKPAQLSYDKENETPAVKSSICVKVFPLKKERFSGHVVDTRY